jgi:aminoglycoside phosphotransferase family enzyme
MIDAASITLDEKLDYLRGLCSSGDEAIETHFAWVFLIGERALKLRKPVRRDTMDYSTLAARHLDSDEEVRLNRRLAPDVYLRALPLVVRQDGRIALDGAGETIDWLVEMRRLDRDRMLDAALQRGEASERALRRVVDLLTAFYASSEPAISDAASYLRRLEHQAEANHHALESLDAGRATMLLERQRAFLGSRRAWLESRVARGCIIEAHGDLRPEHILLAEPPAVIDCLEFDLHLRILDRAEELCFLELECSRLGHAATGQWLLRECLARLSDDAPEPLLRFYRSHRAATRAKLYTWRAREPDGGTPAEWLERSGQYLETALEDARLSLG